MAGMSMNVTGTNVAGLTVARRTRRATGIKQGVDIMKSNRMSTSAAALLLAAMTFAGGVAATAQEADVTRVGIDDRDPLAWIGDREVRFVARAREGGAILRSGPNDNYHKVRVVPEGSLVLVVGDLPPQHLEVLVPTGYRAYIHERYVDVADDHVGRVNSSRVNLRAIPTSRDNIPITSLDQGVELLVWEAAEGSPGWVSVTPTGAVPLWTSDDQVELVGDLTGALVDQVVDERRGLRESFEAMHVEAALAAERERTIERIPELVLEARQILEQQRERGASADYVPARKLMEEARALQPRGPELALVESLDEEIRTAERDKVTIMQREQVVARQKEESRRVTTSPPNASAPKSSTTPNARITELTTRPWTPPPVVAADDKVALPKHAVGDVKSFRGFLRHRPSDTANPLAIETGDRVVAYVHCPSGRYKLRDFVGLQVAVKGRVDSVLPTPKVDVQRLEQIRK